jgi:hypothetical protein
MLFAVKKEDRQAKREVGRKLTEMAQKQMIRYGN